VLQERTCTRVGDHQAIPADVRIIAATHRDLAAEVKVGRFREDLFYRLNVVNLQVPPLRDRREDIPLLINHFLQKYNRQNYKNVEEVPRHVLEMLITYPWPGNIRELENCVQKAVVLAPGSVLIEELVPVTIKSYSENLPAAERVTTKDLPGGDPERILSEALIRYADLASPEIQAIFQHTERVLIAHTLNQERGVKLRAAKLLGINRVTLDRKLVEYDIHVKRGKGVVTAEEADPLEVEV
jgi:DNA-binding NtrC family response regulator